MTINTISIKNFITDLPRILNENFTAIKNLFTKVYDEDTDTVKATNVSASGKVVANSVITNYMTVKLSNGSTVTISDIIARLEALENNQ